MRLIIREVREARGWTLTQLHEASGLPLSVLSRYERGLRPVPLARLVCLAQVLGVGLDALVRIERAERPPTC
jgi:transcriptional regulator with XRE-family HTH domain